MKRLLSLYAILFVCLFLTRCANDTSPETVPVEGTAAPTERTAPLQALEPIPDNAIKLPKNNDGGLYYVKGRPHGLKPGDVVLLEGDYAYINFDGVIGTAEKPIIFRVKDSVRAGVKNSYGFIITNSKYFIIDGRTAAEPYGLKIGGLAGQYIAQSFTFPGSEKFEIMGVELKNAQVGFFANPKTGYGGPFGTIKIHDNYVHHIDNPSESGRSEGVYIGRTDTASRKGHGGFYDVEIYNNLFEGLAGDGIQVALCENVYIHHNRIKGYGRANLQQQRSAIIVGGCTSGRVEDNEITDGTGSPVQIFGGGEVIAQRNKMLRVATSANEDGF